MGTQNLFFLKTHFDLLCTCFLLEFLYGKMIWVVRSFRVFLFDYVFYAFGVIIRNIFRFKDDDANNEEDFRLLKSSSGSENGGIGEEGGVSENLAMSCISPTTSKCKFMSGREVDGFIEEPDSVCWIKQQFCAENYDSKACGVQIIEVPPDESSGEFASMAAEKEEVLEKGGQEVLSEHGHGDSEEEDEFGSGNKNEILAAGDFREANFEREAMDEEKWDYFVQRLGTEEKIKPEIECKNEKDYQFFTNLDMLPEIQVVGDDYSIPSDTDSDSMNSSDGGFAKSNHEEVEETEETFRDRESNLGSEICYSDEDFIELELQINDPVPAMAKNPLYEDPQKLEEDNERENSVQEVETYRREEPSVMSYNEYDELETAPEHEDLIEQLKRELKNVRTGGLPTIWENGSELESPSMIDRSLKALKIDQKYEQKDQIEESQKVSKAYEEKMRKLDILNDQTMNAIGILQLKTQNHLIWRPKSSIPAIKPFISHNFWPRKSQKSVADSSIKFPGDLHKELELVYVGQICLSWEIMYWQHRKVLQLQEHESKGLGRYEFNQVATDFQTFQILLDRFVENDKFHGSRVENYVRNRCVMRKFLQVPPIKGDCLKDKNVAKNKEVINGGMLAQMIEESIRAFHEFICADKDERKQTQTDLEDPADSTLLDDTKAALQKKEKQLKEIRRSRNCIVKKLQKNKEERMNYTLIVARVELKVVGRALRMSRLTKSQLYWCSQKLDQVSFFRGKKRLYLRSLKLVKQDRPIAQLVDRFLAYPDGKIEDVLIIVKCRDDIMSLLHSTSTHGTQFSNLLDIV